MAKKKYSYIERQAYWVGVGASAGRFGGFNELINTKNSKVKKSLIAGFTADDKKDVTKKFR